MKLSCASFEPCSTRNVDGQVARSALYADESRRVEHVGRAVGLGERERTRRALPGL